MAQGQKSSQLSIEFTAHLGDPPLGETALACQIRRPFARHQPQSDPGLAFGQHIQPGREVDAESGLLVGRRDRVVLKPLLEGVEKCLSVRVAVERLVVALGGEGQRFNTELLHALGSV